MRYSCFRFIIAIVLHVQPANRCTAPRGQPRPRGASPGRDQGRCKAGGAPRQRQQENLILALVVRANRPCQPCLSGGVRGGQELALAARKLVGALAVGANRPCPRPAWGRE